MIIDKFLSEDNDEIVSVMNDQLILEFSYKALDILNNYAIESYKENTEYDENFVVDELMELRKELSIKLNGSEFAN